MASNPRIPEKLGPQRVPKPKLTLTKNRRAWWPWLILGVIIALWAIGFYLLPRNPKQMAPPTNAQVPMQPTGAAVQLSQLRMSPLGPDNTLNIDGMLFNNGNQSIIGVQTEALFRDQSGNAIGRATAPMFGIDKNAGPTRNFVDDPIKPQAQRPFRLQFANIPANWNHQMPELRITDVSGTTPGKPGI